MESARKYRIGIDVGGTFTDVVAIDAATREIVGSAKAPTSHTAEEGVARGIIEALRDILQQLKIAPGQIVFLAHSTTQATNALLEGDVSRIGIISTGSGMIGWQTKVSASLGDLELAEGRLLRSVQVFVKAASETFEADLQKAIAQLKTEKVAAVVAAEAFSVDAPELEKRIAEAARAAGFPTSATHEVSSLYGLKLRVRTAALNAAILPRMMETSERTAAGVLSSGIEAPLMIMRSDGGVMSLDEMRRRPILSFLSGPAAGIAGALMYEKISDGIFLEGWRHEHRYIGHSGWIAANPFRLDRRAADFSQYSMCGRSDWRVEVCCGFGMDVWLASDRGVRILLVVATSVLPRPRSWRERW